MDEGDLRAFVDGAREALERSPGMSVRTTELRIVLPLIRALGWGIHGPQVSPDYAVELTGDGEGERVEVDYALLVDGDPAVFVVTRGAGEEIDDGTVRRLGTATTAAGVDLGLATNGRSYVLLGRHEDRVERASLDLSDLAADPTPLAHYTRAATERRRRSIRRERRQQAAEGLSGDREPVVAAVTDALVNGAGTDLDGELASVSEAFVDRALDALAAGDHPETAVAGRADGEGDSEIRVSGSRDRSGDADAGTATPAGRDATDGSDPTEVEGEGTAGEDGVTGSPEESEREESEGEESSDGRGGEGDGEYVVRLFNDGASVGAVGHGTAAGATAQAVEFLIEQYGLDSRLQLPWGPDDADGRAILAREPVHPDGTGMSDATQLSNGYYLYADLPPDANRRVVETLAERAGLRVMFQGDWPDGG